MNVETLLLNGIGTLGVGGILAWYLWYTVTKTIPDLNKQNNDTHLRLITDFRADLQLEREVRIREIALLKKLVSKYDEEEPDE